MINYPRLFKKQMHQKTSFTDNRTDFAYMCRSYRRIHESCLQIKECNGENNTTRINNENHIRRKNLKSYLNT